ncbi:hypothetical protein BDK51DRAFT_48451 [Blyttiomyces helicus]|uniref:Uncharacterized protein n=1 Tax=Blyttiomyces helicus TaxID=388810 RepID=A0A4P9WD00_9FUNG|nr:hypothetical protein BDK51DRAFT_48451 [Blyttiomyces helicus]|eukprot:RKO90394.1 hypothetical protein BDK51DRAFT_48451 [Blyttiomyces helicus]
MPSGSDLIRQLFCNPCGAQKAKALQAMAAYLETANELAHVLATCPGGPPTPVADGTLSATALSVPPAKSPPIPLLTRAILPESVQPARRNSSSGAQPIASNTTSGSIPGVHPSVSNSSSSSLPSGHLSASISSSGSVPTVLPYPSNSSGSLPGVHPPASNSSSGSNTPVGPTGTAASSPSASANAHSSAAFTGVSAQVALLGAVAIVAAML